MLSLFGKKRKKSSVQKKPSKELIAKCRKYKIKVTVKRGSKRVYKSEILLERECAKKMKTAKKSTTRVTKKEKWWTDKSYGLSKKEQARMTRAFRTLKDERNK
jgi:hypothetical protein